MSFEERALLHIELGNGASIRSIARGLGRSASTLTCCACKSRPPCPVPRL
nr:helix-turn-helix domain-containing protein [Xanthomonas albilineans]